MIYSGVSNHKRATAGVNILMSEKYANTVYTLHHPNDRKQRVTINSENENINILIIVILMLSRILI